MSAYEELLSRFLNDILNLFGMDNRIVELMERTF